MTASRPTRHGPGIVIAGGGLAAQRAAEALRRGGYDGRIRMVAAEPVEPYDRPPLSKAYLAGEAGEDALRYRAPDWYGDNAVDLLLGEATVALDPAARELTLARGGRLRYDQLLIATGSAPRRLPGTERFDNVHELRTRADAQALRGALVPGARLVVVGAGFIGLEVAATARRLGAEVTIVEAAPAPLAAVLGADIGAWFARLHAQEDVEVLVSAQIARLRGRGRRLQALELEGGRTLPVDALVVGIGTRPATGWLAGSGLETDGGIPVDAVGRTAIPGVFVAGDAGRTFHERLGRHVRTEHWEAAARQGTGAARAMLGQPVPRSGPSTFWSDQHGVRIQCVGHVHGSDAVQIDGDPDARDFLATFTHRGRPVAALLVGRPHALPELRRRLDRHDSEHPNERTAA